MKKESFETWLKGNYISQNKIPNTSRIGNQISRCRRIEKGMNLDLDSEYLSDGGKSLMERLQYTKEDESARKTVPKGIIFKERANIYNGMASLRNAVSDYFQFCRSFR